MRVKTLESIYVAKVHKEIVKELKMEKYSVESMFYLSMDPLIMSRRFTPGKHHPTVEPSP